MTTQFHLKSTALASVFVYLLVIFLVDGDQSGEPSGIRAYHLTLGLFTIGKFHEYLFRVFYEWKLWFRQVQIGLMERANGMDVKRLRIQKERLSALLIKIQSRQTQMIEVQKIRSLGKLTSSLAHELNNPLNVIGGVVDPIGRDLEELRAHVNTNEGVELLDEMELLLQNLRDEATRATKVVSKLVEFSCEEKNSGRFDPLKCFVNKLSWYKMTHPDITFDYQITGCLGFKKGMEDIQHIFNVLLTNAIEACESVQSYTRGKIVVSIEDNAKELVLVVKDNGPGIAGADLNRIFDPFFSTKDEIEVRGLGLFNAHRIIDSYQGEIVADTSNEGGAIFTVRIPKENLREAEQEKNYQNQEELS